MRVACLLFALTVAGSAAPAQEASETAEALLSRERGRAAVESALDEIQHPHEDPADAVANFIRVALELAGQGAGVVPFLVAELAQDLPQSYFFAAYTLGLLPGEASEQALREGLARADRKSGDFATACKAWSAYGLALQGVSESVDLLVNGRHSLAGFMITENTTIPEVAALFNPEGTLPRIYALLDRLEGHADLETSRLFLMRALRRAGDTGSVPQVLEVLRNDERGVMRAEAARTLRTMVTPEGVEALVAALADEDPLVRFRASETLSYLLLPEVRPRIVARLAEETDGGVRAMLYQYVADLGGETASAVLTGYWDRPNPTERAGLVAALGRLGPAAPLATLRAALHGDQRPVTAAAVQALSEVGTPAGDELLISVVRGGSWPVARLSIDALLPRRDPRAAPAVADRLFLSEAAGAVLQPSNWDRLDRLASALVELEHVAALEDLRAATERQTDATPKKMLGAYLEVLEAIHEAGDDTAKWVALARALEPELRIAAYRHLGRTGGPEAAKVLAANFGRVETEEGIEVLRQLRRIGGEPATEVIERVLLDPAFDVPARRGLREEAAWAARTIGGESMRDLLEQSARRRVGRDARVLVYLGVLAGADALPVLDDLRVPRMGFPWGKRGPEQDLLDEIRYRLKSGRTLAEFDVPPERVRY